jgi:hypothetical protein
VSIAIAEALRVACKDQPQRLQRVAHDHLSSPFHPVGAFFCALWIAAWSRHQRIVFRPAQEREQRFRHPILLFRRQLPHVSNHLLKPLGHEKSIPRLVRWRRNAVSLRCSCELSRYARLSLLPECLWKKHTHRSQKIDYVLKTGTIDEGLPQAFALDLEFVCAAAALWGNAHGTPCRPTEWQDRMCWPASIPLHLA